MSKFSKFKKSSLSVIFLAALIPSLASAFYEEDEDAPPIPPDNSGTIGDNSSSGSGGCCPTITLDENGNPISNTGQSNNNSTPPPDSNPSSDSGSSSDNGSPSDPTPSDNNPSVESPSDTSSTTSVSMQVSQSVKQLNAKVTNLSAINASTISATLANTLAQPNVVAMSSVNGPAFVQLADKPANTAVAKADATTVMQTMTASIDNAQPNNLRNYSIPSGIVISEKAGTPESKKLFATIRLNSSEIATVIGVGAKAQAVAQTLIKSGANPDQVKVVAPATNVNHDIVAVKIMSLPTLDSMFNS